MAEELKLKVDDQHREQLSRLKKDQLEVSGWIDQYLGDLKAAKQQVKLDPLNLLLNDVQKFKEGQEKLEQEIQEQLEAEILLEAAFRDKERVHMVEEANLIKT